MKKIYSTILMLAMMIVALGFTACGGSDSDDDNDNYNYGENSSSNIVFTIIHDDGGWCNGRTVSEYKSSELFPRPYAKFERTSSSSRFSFDGYNRYIRIIFRYNQYGKRLLASEFKKGFDKFRSCDVDIMRTYSHEDWEGEPISGTAKVIDNDGKTITIEFDNYKYIYKCSSHTHEETLIGRLSFEINDNENDTYSNPCPDDNHPHTIDLGIGVKWACCNVGAMTPTGLGYFFAWGDTSEEHEYFFYTSNEGKLNSGDKKILSLYKYYDTTSEQFINIGNEIGGTQYDAATKKWGKKYKMPSSKDFQTLIDKCKFKMENSYDVMLASFEGPNGNKLYFPFSRATNCQYLIPSIYTLSHDFNGYYWTGTLSNDSESKCFFLIKTIGWLGDLSRNGCCPIRPIVSD